MLKDSACRCYNVDCPDAEHCERWLQRHTGTIYTPRVLSLTDPKDRQLTKWPKENDPSWGWCFSIAKGVVNGVLPNIIDFADSYYDDSIPPPKWATKENFIVKLGRLNFHDVNP